jgi:hypothetical protein
MFVSGPALSRVARCRRGLIAFGLSGISRVGVIAGGDEICPAVSEPTPYVARSGAAISSMMTWRWRSRSLTSSSSARQRRATLSMARLVTASGVLVMLRQAEEAGSASRSRGGVTDRTMLAKRVR